MARKTPEAGRLRGRSVQSSFANVTSRDANEALVQHIKRVDGVWFATHEEVARYCQANA